MFDAGSEAVQKKVARRLSKEVQCSIVFQGRGIGDVDGDRRPRKYLSKSFTGKGVDAGVERRGNRLMTVCNQLLYKLGSCESGTTNDYDFHACSFLATRGVVSSSRY